MAKINFTDVDQSTLKWGNPCKHNHIGPNNFNVRYASGGCLACQKKLPDGPYEFVFENIKGDLPRVPLSKEERRLRQIAHSKNWNNKNPERVRENQLKYENKHEVKVMRKEAYAGMDPDKKEALKKKQNDYYQRRITAMTPEEKKEFNHKNAVAAKIRYAALKAKREQE